LCAVLEIESKHRSVKCQPGKVAAHICTWSYEAFHKGVFRLLNLDELRETMALDLCMCRCIQHLKLGDCIDMCGGRDRHRGVTGV
jgi:hypothetical protein